MTKNPTMLVRVTDDGSIVLLRPLDPESTAWFAEHLPEDGPMLGNAYAVEPHYVADILKGFAGDGGWTA
jgi:hypothetical protein